MELIEIRIKRNLYGAIVDGIQPGALGGLVTLRTVVDGDQTPSTTMVALTSDQIDEVLSVLSAGVAEAAERMVSSITAAGIRHANTAPASPAPTTQALEKLERAAAEAKGRGA